MQEQPTVIYVTHAAPSAVGNGGVHRSYQIHLELQALVGPERVLLLTEQGLRAQFRQTRARQNGHHVRPERGVKSWFSFRAATVTRGLKNPYRLLHRTPFVTGLHPQLKAYYEEQVRALPGRAVCVIDHAQFAELIPVNRKYRIPTVSCTQNFDALAQNLDGLNRSLTALGTPQAGQRFQLGVYAALTDFANELQALAQCDERLFISRLEAGLINGLGLSAHYHPYRPVGAIRERQEAIRQRRAERAQEPGLFLMLGTATYGPIRKSCEWLIEHARRDGLPPGTQVVMIGAGTDKLLPPTERIAGLTLKGWSEQAELDELLVRARAVLVPQQAGFGVPTRLSELSCAGIPVLGGSQPTYAIEPPPGFHTLADAWADWYAQLAQLSEQDTQVSAADYDAWEAAQPQPLAGVIKNLLN